MLKYNYQEMHLFSLDSITIIRNVTNCHHSHKCNFGKFGLPKQRYANHILYGTSFVA